MKISLIIPIYNVEQYVERCILSCSNQNIDISEYEIIVIDDGSPDNSIDIVERLARKNINIKIFSQKNQGLSQARNKGLEIAKGEYVWFIDSDDWIEENCILELYNICHEFNLDVLLFDAIDFDGNIFKIRNTITQNVCDVIEGKQYLNSNNIIFPVCFKVFKREFLIENSIYFLKNIFHEDNEFTPRMFYFANRVMCINKPLYYVFHNPNSITRSVNPQKAYDLIEIAMSYVNFIDQNKVDKKIRVLFINLIGLVLNSSLAEIFFMNKSEKFYFFKYLKKNQNLFYCLKKSSVIKYKIEGFLFMISSSLFFKIYSRLYFVFYKKNV